MKKVGMPLLLHGEVTDQDMDVFDHEKILVEKYMIPLNCHNPRSLHGREQNKKCPTRSVFQASFARCCWVLAQHVMSPK
ncbi:Dihydroorotase [Acaryochloris thomasi RCC1774]|uniref:Dihydroorotase n=1 Tax=Acaryochloris thomasi RCC1774 TaxID=1764569 RepID=A0A2W1JRP3_9CYAN|nr:Dihydroorotase [Acaryochloris thomasi RCC1774]